MCSSDLIRLSDTTVSRLHAEIVRGRDGTILRDLGSTNGTFVGAVRVKEVYLAPDTRFRVGNTHLIFSPADEIIDVVPSQSDRFEGLVGRGLAMREVFGILERVAPTELTVLVTGETGTGKELVSRAIHNRSRRGGRPFVVFDCGAAPETLVESELFGHERGAFTDAKATKKGLLELADGGTLLLDEIGDMKPALQAKLLRVLETRTFRRVGGGKDITVDVRVIASTNKNLDQAVANGEFRQDLLYRLKVIAVRLPALADRREDIPELAEYFMKQFATEFSKPLKTLTPSAREVLTKYDWPGNVRELRNVMERLVILESAPVIEPQHLPSELRAGTTPAQRPIIELPAGGVKLTDVERELVRQAMERAGQNQTHAAELLGLERDALRRRLIKYGYLEQSSEVGAAA